MNRKNLKLLANHLYHLPEYYEHFDMEMYADDLFSPYHENEIVGSPIAFYKEVKKEIPCGTVACAAGHASLVKGIPKPKKDEEWDDYVNRVFEVGKGYLEEWEWLFSPDWKEVDNTPRGAAQRIYWFIEHGLPENWMEQKFGEDDLCYQGMTPND